MLGFKRNVLFSLQFKGIYLYAEKCYYFPSNILKIILRTSTGCPHKKVLLLWRAITPLIMVEIAKSRTPLQRAQVDASVTFNNISRVQKSSGIFEFKVDCFQK